LKHAKFSSTKTQLKRFMGMCIVHTRFFEDVSEWAKLLNALTTAEVPPDSPMPTDAAAASFEDLRNAQLCPPMLALAKKVGDSSSTGKCAPTTFDAPPYRRNRVTYFTVRYWSRGLPAAAQNYSRTAREYLGVVCTVLKLRHFLDGERLFFQTDY